MCSPILTYVAASPGGGNRCIRAVDLTVIALLWLLYFVHTRAMAHLNTALWTQCLHTLSNVQNSLVFCFALIRFLAEDNADRRDFFRTLTIYALGYFLMALYINTWQPQVPDGGWGDLLISGCSCCWRPAARTAHRRWLCRATSAASSMPACR